jgi:hypothetical protein
MMADFHCSIDDLPSTSSIAEHVQKEKSAYERAEQERKDHEIALRLSQQDSPSPANAALPQKSDAFSRLMETQRLNGSPASSPEQLPTASSLFPSDNTAAPMNEPSYSMPGAYDPAWAKPAQTPGNMVSTHPGQAGPHGNNMSLPGQFPTTPQQAMQNGRVNTTPASYGLSGQPYPSTLARYANAAAHTPGGYSVAGGNSAFTSGSPAYDRFSRASSMMNGFNLSGLQSSSGGALSNIINRTSMFNYAGGTGGVGSNLPDRLTNFLDDVVHDPRVSDKELDDLLKNIRPDMDLPEKNRDGTPEGLRSSLYAHQEVALRWMKSMEEGTNKGGILADDMGLGKTITTLSLMLSRKAKQKPKVNV